MKVDTGVPVAARMMRAGTAAGRGGGTAFATHLAEATGTGAATGRGPVARVGALVPLAAFEGEPDRRRRAVRRGGKLLDLLDELRLGLLAGGTPTETLAALARTVGEARDGVDDPALSAVLDEIDLRAQVELAKHEKVRRPA